MNARLFKRLPCESSTPTSPLLDAHQWKMRPSFDKMPLEMEIGMKMEIALRTMQILTQEDWNVVLFNGMEKTSHWAALYFVALMTFGNYVLFNLLVAILVEGFSSEVEFYKSKPKIFSAKILYPNLLIFQINCFYEIFEIEFNYKSNLKILLTTKK